MKKTILGMLVVLTVGALALAADPVCPPPKPPKPPTCAERIARAKANGCIIQPAPETVTVTKEVPVPGPERLVTKEVPVPVPGPERVVTQTVTVEVPAKPKGHALVGLGPMWFHDWGATAVAGYQFKNGWQIQGGPTWMPQHDINGTVNPCDDYDERGRGAWCYAVPFQVPAKSPWGAQVLVLYVF
jgi:hypothetical protein